jgi:muramoyltetrapeptide carboxypeptidase
LSDGGSSLLLFSPSGVVAQKALLRRAERRLGALGFEVRSDDGALARHERFAGDDETRLAAIHRAAASGASIAMATRGGYGLTRLLDRIDWKKVARSALRGTFFLSACGAGARQHPHLGRADGLLRLRPHGRGAWRASRRGG